LNIEWRVNNPGGPERWLMSRGRPEHDEQDRVIRYLGIVIDITHRKRVEQEIEILADIGRLISSTIEIDKVYERVASETRKLIPFDSLMVNLNKQEENELIITYVSGLDIPGRKKGDRIPFKGSLSEMVACTKKGMLIQSESEEIVKKFPHLIHVIQVGLISTISVPLISSDKVIGVLVFRSKTRAAYTKQDLLLAEKIGTQIAGAIASAQLYKELRETEKALRESEGKFRLLVEHSPDPIYVQIHGCFAYVNPAAVRLYRAESDRELLGCPILDRVHPDYQENVRERMRLDRKSVV
jgi:PAS domain-containing protein